MKNFSMLIAAALAATTFAAGAADKAPIQLTESQMGQVVAGATPGITGAGLCTSLSAGGNAGTKNGNPHFAYTGNPSHTPGPQDLYRGFGRYVGPADTDFVTEGPDCGDLRSDEEPA